MWYIIRHGQTLENALRIQQGHYDSLLSLRGINQAQSIAYRMLDSNENFLEYKFITSPLARARHTTQIILETLHIAQHIKPIIEPMLINRSKGIFDGIDKDKIQTLYPDEYAKREQDVWNYIPPNATESKSDSVIRIQKFIDKYKNENKVVIVAHRGINYFIREILQGKTLEDIKNSTLKPDKSQNNFYLWNKKEMIRL